MEKLQERVKNGDSTFFNMLLRYLDLFNLSFDNLYEERGYQAGILEDQYKPLVLELLKVCLTRPASWGKSSSCKLVHFS